MTNSNSISATPLTPSTLGLAVSSSNINPVLTAPIDTILFNDDSVPVEIMADIIFENIGGQELISIARNDTVNGQTVLYQPIKNLTAVQQQYNPNNIVSLQATSDKYFQNFSIKFDEKVPTEGTGPGGSHVYIDPETGELIVEAVNLAEDEQIEVEITISGTIYEADI
jgi:alpha-L-arabinofuranosidase